MVCKCQCRGLARFSVPESWSVDPPHAPIRDIFFKKARWPAWAIGGKPSCLLMRGRVGLHRIVFASSTVRSSSMLLIVFLLLGGIYVVVHIKYQIDSI